MAKLIPGKIRSEGILLYENGKVSLQEMKNQYLYFRIDNDFGIYVKANTIDLYNDKIVFDLYQKK